MLELLLLANRYYIRMDTCMNISKVHAVVINNFFSIFSSLVSHSSQIHPVRLTNAEQFEGAVVSV